MKIKIVSKMAGGIAAKHIHHLVRAIGFMNQPRLGLVGYLKKNIKIAIVSAFFNKLRHLCSIK
jgi:hypothetical protein